MKGNNKKKKKKKKENKIQNVCIFKIRFIATRNFIVPKMHTFSIRFIATSNFIDPKMKKKNVLQSDDFDQIHCNK
jgi:hypothetical protein